MTDSAKFFDDLANAQSSKPLEENSKYLEALLLEAETGHDRSEVGEIDKTAAESAKYEVPNHSDLPPQYKGMYVRYSGSCKNQHWGTEATVKAALNIAYSWWKAGKAPTLLIGDLSAKNFGQTGCHSAHKTGTHIDLDLAGTLPSDSGYNRDKRTKCAIVCWLAIQAGARRVLFGDPIVVKAVNDLAKKKGFSGRVVNRADHDNHFHIEMPL